MATVTSIHKNKGEPVAVLLNANAKSVSERLRQEIGKFVPDEDVYYSRSLDDARQITRQVLDRGYSTVLTGGGDGTFVGYVNEMRALAGNAPRMPLWAQGGAAPRISPQPARLPRYGVLKLGTGNALAHLLGSSGSAVGVVEDILRARSGEVRQTRSLYMVDAERKLAPFAGMGIDAKVLNDYVAVKTRLGSTPLAALGTGELGYFLAVTCLSIPSVMMQRKTPHVRIINEGAPAQQLGPDGRPVGRPIETGEVIYDGPCRIAAAGTVPTYGYGFTIFPHALKEPGRMHLRVTAMSVPEILRHLPAIWKGRTPTSGLLDFHVEKVRMTFDRPMPYQVGGDAEGYRDEVVLGVDPVPVEMLDFKACA